MELIKIINTNELPRVRPEDVVCLRAEGNYTYMTLCTGKEYKFTRQIGEFAKVFEQMDINPFIRVGRSLIVNKRYVFQINLTDQHIILAGNGLNRELVVTARRDPLCELMERLIKDGGQ